ncbi:hypothetical protein [Novispirillum itersonii]|uniref:Uncharacterized protein n=1 Tax=Novispirillum itersonii TaxID=189 RepID=A0A7W9ZGP6_NOVIT|nr:hypothetical protein [Novispirillum itersonii]MBB6211105.1 hypothetical protein [Novispirillum itersonii]
MGLLNFILQTVVGPANTPGSRLFLPDQLAGLPGSNSSGRLLPVQVDTIPVGAISDPAGANIGQAIAGQWFYSLPTEYGSTMHPIVDPSTPDPVLTLGDGTAASVTVAGLNNAYIQSVRQVAAPVAATDPYRFSVTLTMNTYPDSGSDPIPPLQVSGPYTLAQKYDTAALGSNTPNGVASYDLDGGGTVSVVVSNVQITVDLAVSAQTANGVTTGLQATVSGITVGGIPGADGKATSLQLGVKALTMDASVSKILLGVWRQQAVEALTSADAEAAIQATINAQLAGPDVLSTLSQQITENLGSVLDGLMGPVTGPLPVSQNDGGQSLVDQYLFDRALYAFNSPSSQWFLPTVLCSLSDPQLNPYAAGTVSLPDFGILGQPVTAVALTDLVVSGLPNVDAPAQTTTFFPNGATIVANVPAYAPPPAGVTQAGLVLTSGWTMALDGTPLTGTAQITVQAATLTMNVTGTGDSSQDLVLTVNALTLGVPQLSGVNIVITVPSSFGGFINTAVNTDGTKQAILNEVNSQLNGVLGQLSQAVTGYVQQAIRQHLQTALA